MGKSLLHMNASLNTWMYPNDIFSRMYAGESDTKLHPKKEEAPSEVDDILQTNLFNVMLNRRSQRKFDNREIEDWKLEMIFAAADTAPTAGGFQGFEIYRVKNPDIKLNLVQASNNQPYVNAPVVLVFCMNPSRVKMNFPAAHHQKVLRAGCYTSGGLCTAGGART